jgi:hypothetical protein
VAREWIIEVRERDWEEVKKAGGQEVEWMVAED